MFERVLNMPLCLTLHHFISVYTTAIYYCVKPKSYEYPGAIPDIFKREVGVLYVDHHGWPTKKILGLRWFEKAKITLETQAFGKIFKSTSSSFLQFLYKMKSCR